MISVGSTTKTLPTVDVPAPGWIMPSSSATDQFYAQCLELVASLPEGDELGGTRRREVAGVVERTSQLPS